MTQRRMFLRSAGSAALAGAASGAALIASPAIHAQGSSVRWRLGSSFPKSLDTIYGGAEDMAKKLSALTSGRFTIDVNPGGVLAKPLETLDPVSRGDFECTHTAAYYFSGKDETFAIDGAIPFGMSARLLTAWMYDGDGLKLLRDFYARKYNIVNIPCGNTGTQMGGWYRNEIKTPLDVQGLKMRIGTFGGRILQTMGGTPVPVAAGDIAAALTEGKIDAAEWIGPYDDEKLGLHKVAPYYYYPGWWEGSLQLTLMINKRAHDALPAEFKEALEAACAFAHINMQAKYDARNGPALDRMVKSGTKMRVMPQPIMDTAYAASTKVYEGLKSTNPEWKKIYPNYLQFQREGIKWFRYAENTYDNFMSRLMAR